MQTRYFCGQSGDKYSTFVENYYGQKALSLLDRKKYSYVLILGVSGIKGVIVYCDVTRTTCNLHIHADGCLRSRRTLQVMLDYPFNQLGLRKIFGTISSSNHKACVNAQKIGFTLAHTVNDYYDSDVHMLVYALTAQDAQRWIS